MPTPSEQKALAFLAFVLLLGGAVRVLRAGTPPLPTLAEQQALAVQTDAAQRAAGASQRREGRVSRRMTRSRRNGVADTVAGVASVPFADARPDRTGGTALQYNPREGWVNGYPPPSPRVDSDNRQSAPAQGIVPGAGRRRYAANAPVADTQHVDLDVADARTIDGLPRIGPALAARLVANRDSFGPFRSLDGLRRVRGMGPATIQVLAPRVTFSGRAASSSAGSHYH